MTQHILVYSTQKKNSLELVKNNDNTFLLEAANTKMPYASMEQVYSFDIDTLMLDAQKQLANKDFRETELYLKLSTLIPDAKEIVLWYGSDYSDIDYIEDSQEFLARMKDAVSDSFCEAYIHFKKNP